MRVMAMKRKLNFRFHNPNSPEVTARYIADVMVQANLGKVEKIIREHMENPKANDEETEESRIAG